LANAAAGQWPEAGLLPQRTNDDFISVFRKWAIIGGLLVAFIIVGLMLVTRFVAGSD
jgi:hypothetical protein